MSKVMILPSPEGVIWVIQHLREHSLNGESYRMLVKRLGVHYEDLQEAGGLMIHNALSEELELQEAKAEIERLKTLCGRAASRLTALRGGDLDHGSPALIDELREAAEGNDEPAVSPEETEKLLGADPAEEISSPLEGLNRFAHRNDISEGTDEKH